MKTFPKAFIISSTGSSSGKTILSLGLMALLRRTGLRVQAFKAGPDYIDPSLHALLLKRPCYNLDTWMMGEDGVKGAFSRNMIGSDMGVIEGAMGLFDGKAGSSGQGSTAHIARLLDIPVLLVVNAAKTGSSVGAIVKGFSEFDGRVRVKWVLFNMVGSREHYNILKASIPASLGVKVIGFFPRDPLLGVPERHLGLVTSDDIERGAWFRLLRRATGLVKKNIDVNAFIDSIPRIKVEARPAKDKGDYYSGEPVRIAVARDRAFSFYYEENLEILRRYGAEIVFFSPIKDKRLPRGARGIYIGGGYPELYAKELGKNLSMKSGIREAAEAGMPIYAECGGLMYLGGAIRDLKGRAFSMAHVFPWTTKTGLKRKAIGYREVAAKKGCPLLSAGGLIRGHEFHYSSMSRKPGNGIKRVFSVKGSFGGPSEEGYVRKNVLATYVHLCFASNPEFVARFVGRARQWPPSGRLS
ncbi:MAG: cobyrinate a,c-diamide synthase [Deltaproteobacteria bacterium]